MQNFDEIDTNVCFLPHSHNTLKQTVVVVIPLVKGYLLCIQSALEIMVKSVAFFWFLMLPYNLDLVG